PPSDQLVNPYVPPPSCCGEVALTLVAEPRITVFVNGVVPTVLPTTSWRPDGNDFRLRSTVLGQRNTLWVVWRPPLSVAVRSSSVHEGHSWSGAANEPRLTPSNC